MINAIINKFYESENTKIVLGLAGAIVLAGIIYTGATEKWVGMAFLLILEIGVILAAYKYQTGRNVSMIARQPLQGESPTAVFYGNNVIPRSQVNTHRTNSLTNQSSTRSYVPNEEL